MSRMCTEQLSPTPCGTDSRASRVLNLSCRAETALCTGDVSHPSQDVSRDFPSLGCWWCSFPVQEVPRLLSDVSENMFRSQAHLYSRLTLPAGIDTASARHPSRAEHPSVFCPGTEVCMVSCCWLSTSFRGVSCKPRSMIWIHLWLGRMPQAEGVGRSVHGDSEQCWLLTVETRVFHPKCSPFIPPKALQIKSRYLWNQADRQLQCYFTTVHV